MINAEFVKKTPIDSLQIETKYFQEGNSLWGLNHRQTNEEKQIPIDKVNHLKSNEQVTSARTLTLM